MLLTVSYCQNKIHKARAYIKKGGFEAGIQGRVTGKGYMADGAMVDTYVGDRKPENREDARLALKEPHIFTGTSQVRENYL